MNLADILSMIKKIEKNSSDIQQKNYAITTFISVLKDNQVDEEIIKELNLMYKDYISDHSITSDVTVDNFNTKLDQVLQARAERQRRNTRC